MTSNGSSRRWLWSGLAFAVAMSVIAAWLPSEESVVAPAASDRTTAGKQLSAQTGQRNADTVARKGEEGALSALQVRQFALPEETVFTISPSATPPKWPIKQTPTVVAPPVATKLPPPPPAPPPLTNPWKLAGLYIEGNKQYFILNRANPNLEKVVAAGESLDEMWQLKSVTADTLTVAHKPNGQTFAVPIVAK